MLPLISHQAPAQAKTDSPIQLISIRPAPAAGTAAKRNNRRMPPVSSTATDGFSVVNIERLRADALKPLAGAAEAGGRSKAAGGAVRVNLPLPPMPPPQPVQNRSARPMRGNQRIATLPFQRGEWLRYDPGPSPVYYARARANGLFQLHTLKVAKL